MIAKMEDPNTMDAVVFSGPWKIETLQRPKPVILDQADAIIKIAMAGICGSELHMYRGLQETGTGHIMGHEFTGTIESIGSDVQHFQVGQRVVSTFSVVCMSCWFCKHGHTNRCVHGAAFGTQKLAGGQSEYVRVPYADGTLHALPDFIEDELAIMMCDIFPTGYYGASRAIDAFSSVDFFVPDAVVDKNIKNLGAQFVSQSVRDAVFVCLGCGPVGLCAIMTARSKGVNTIFVIDSVDDRLVEAAKLGGIPLKLGRDDVQAVVLAATDGRGADAVIEVVGNKAALRSAFDLLRSCGTLSSIGFHQGELPFTALESYQKNLNINLGRAPVRSVFEEALEIAVLHRAQLASMITHRLLLAEAGKGYAKFEKEQARKVVLLI